MKETQTINKMLSGLSSLEMIYTMLFEACFVKQEVIVSWPELRQMFSHCLAFWTPSEQSKKYYLIWLHYRELIVVGVKKECV